MQQSPVIDFAGPFAGASVRTGDTKPRATGVRAVRLGRN